MLREAFASTDDIINKIKWGNFGIDKIFSSKLRFQARDSMHLRIVMKADLFCTVVH